MMNPARLAWIGGLVWASANCSRGDFAYVSQGGQVLAQASYTGYATDTQSKQVPAVPTGSFGLVANAFTGSYPSSYAAGTGWLNVTQTPDLLEVGAAGAGGGNFPDAGGGGGLASYQLVFVIPESTQARLILNNSKGQIRLVSDSGFQYDLSGQVARLDQLYTLPSGNYSLTASGQGGGGRDLNGRSYGDAYTVEFSMHLLPSPGAGFVLVGALAIRGFRRPTRPDVCGV